MRRLPSLLILLAALWPAVALGGVFTTPAVTPPLPTLTYDQAAAVFQKLDAAWDATPATDKRPLITDRASAQRWAAIILPYFVTEGIVDPEKLVAPTSIQFHYYTDPDYAFHVLGTTGLCSTDVDLNARMVTPGDPWASEDIQLVVLTHELAHVQGVCYGGTAVNDEQSAQLISWEIDAAMANGGCGQCRANLLADLRGRQLGVVEATAKAEGRETDLARLEAATLSPAEQAQRARSDRQWALGDQDELAAILHDYYTVPMAAWVCALAAGQDHIDGVQLPVNVLQEYLPPGVAKPLLIDDLAYFWENL